MVELVIRNGWVVGHESSFFGGVAIDAGVIVAADVESSLPKASRVVDAEGGFILPGLIDPHVHMASEEDESIEAALAQNLPSESAGMLLGGVTTFGHFVGAANQPLIPMIEETEKGLNTFSYADSFVHAFVMRKEEIETLDRAWDLGVTSFKHFYTAYGRRAHEDAGLGALFAPVDTDVLIRSMRWLGTKRGGGIAMVHAEDGDIVDVASEEVQSSGRLDLGAWSAGRPTVAEAFRASQAIRLAEWTRCPLYVVHVTAAETVELIGEARRRGVQVWGEAGPQWLTHDETMELEIGCWGKVNPPLRSAADRYALWNGIRSGAIRCFGTDHGTGGRTRATKEKGRGKHKNIWAARPGIRGGSQHMLPVLATYGIDQGEMTWETLVRLGSYNTAHAFGLYPRKGGLWPGADADVVVVDPGLERTVDDSFYYAPCEVSIYQGRRLRGAVRWLTLRGMVCVDEYEVQGEPGSGRYVTRPIA